MFLLVWWFDDSLIKHVQPVAFCLQTAHRLCCCRLGTRSQLAVFRQEKINTITMFPFVYREELETFWFETITTPAKITHIINIIICNYIQEYHDYQLRRSSIDIIQNMCLQIWNNNYCFFSKIHLKIYFSAHSVNNVHNVLSEPL